MGKNTTSAKVNTATATATTTAKGKGNKGKELAPPPAEILLDVPETGNPETPATTETGNPELKPIAEITREEVVALAKELNTIADCKIPLKANASTEFITAQIENNIILLTDSDFVEQEGQVCFTKAAINTFLSLGFVIPTTANKTAETIATEKATTKGKAKVKSEKVDKYTRAHAFIEVLSKGATKKELTDEAATLYEAKGGKHNATSGEWYAVEYLKILILAGAVVLKEDGKYHLTTTV